MTVDSPGREFERHLEQNPTVRERLRALVATCQAVGARCAGIVWPIPLRRHAARFAALNDLAVKWLAEVGLTAVTVDERFERHAADELLLSPFDPHPSALANRLVAEAVRDFLVRGGHVSEAACRSSGSEAPTAARP